MAPLGFPELPQELQNINFILLAEIKAKSGKQDQVREALAKCRARALSAEEPKTHTYRTTESPTNGVFIVFEEYEGASGIEEHAASPALLDLVKSGITESVDIKYFKEFK